MFHTCPAFNMFGNPRFLSQMPPWAAALIPVPHAPPQRGRPPLGSGLADIVGLPFDELGNPRFIECNATV